MPLSDLPPLGNVTADGRTRGVECGLTKGVAHFSVGLMAALRWHNPGAVQCHPKLPDLRYHPPLFTMHAGSTCQWQKIVDSFPNNTKLPLEMASESATQCSDFTLLRPEASQNSFLISKK